MEGSSASRYVWARWSCFLNEEELPADEEDFREVCDWEVSNFGKLGREREREKFAIRRTVNGQRTQAAPSDDRRRVMAYYQVYRAAGDQIAPSQCEVWSSPLEKTLLACKRAVRWPRESSERITEENHSPDIIQNSSEDACVEHCAYAFRTTNTGSRCASELTLVRCETLMWLSG